MQGSPGLYVLRGFAVALSEVFDAVPIPSSGGLLLEATYFTTNFDPTITTRLFASMRSPGFDVADPSNFFIPRAPSSNVFQAGLRPLRVNHCLLIPPGFHEVVLEVCNPSGGSTTVVVMMAIISA